MIRSELVTESQIAGLTPTTSRGDHAESNPLNRSFRTASLGVLKSTKDTIQAAMTRRIAFSVIFADRTMCHLWHTHILESDVKKFPCRIDRSTFNPGYHVAPVLFQSMPNLFVVSATVEGVWSVLCPSACCSRPRFRRWQRRGRAGELGFTGSPAALRCC